MKKHFLLCIIASFSLFVKAQNQENEMMALNRNPFITFTDHSGITIETQITVEKEGEYILITFWEETNNGFLFKNENWEGNVVIGLDNGKKIELIDRNMNGHEMLRGGYIAGYFVPDLYQRYSSYFLSDAECKLLKNNEITNVAYQLDDEWGIQERFMTFGDKGFSLQNQLVAIGK